MSDDRIVYRKELGVLAIQVVATDQAMVMSVAGPRGVWEYSWTHWAWESWLGMECLDPWGSKRLTRLIDIRESLSRYMDGMDLERLFAVVERHGERLIQQHYNGCLSVEQAVEYLDEIKRIM